LGPVRMQALTKMTSTCSSEKRRRLIGNKRQRTGPRNLDLKTYLNRRRRKRSSVSDFFRVPFLSLGDYWLPVRIANDCGRRPALPLTRKSGWRGSNPPYALRSQVGVCTYWERSRNYVEPQKLHRIYHSITSRPANQISFLRRANRCNPWDPRACRRPYGRPR